MLQHNIAARLDLEEIAATHELIERGQIAGNVELRIGSLDNNICLLNWGNANSRPWVDCVIAYSLYF